jgi:hypothetical protein
LGKVNIGWNNIEKNVIIMYLFHYRSNRKGIHMLS